MKFGLKLVVHWPRFGPYHLARLRATQAQAQTLNAQVIGLEIASRDKTYQWREEASSDVERQVVFPGRVREEVGQLKLWQGIFAKLGQLQPDVVAVNGYSAPDAAAVLAWCRLNRVPALLMTESKADDAPRIAWKEQFKRAVVAQFSACLCGGSPHKAYAEQLGLSPRRVFTGYDAVDNDYFWQAAEKVRQAPAIYRALPGLADPRPFFLASARFITRKNLDGLLRAYGKYRLQVDAAAGEHIPWRLVLVGDGEQRQALEQFVGAESIPGVTFAGFRQIDELPAYYGLAGVFIHPPHQEQWGLVVNEAMAAGLPVLVSKQCGSAPDLVVEGQNGFTFEAADIDHLADLLFRFSAGQVDVNVMGAASRQRIAQWGPPHFAQGMWSAVNAIFPDIQKG